MLLSICEPNGTIAWGKISILIREETLPVRGNSKDSQLLFDGQLRHCSDQHTFPTDKWGSRAEIGSVNDENKVINTSIQGHSFKYLH